MSAHFFEFMHQPLPLRLRRVQQFQADNFARTLVEGFALPLVNPSPSAPERSAATERLLHARRRELATNPV